MHEALLKKLGVEDYGKLLARQAAVERPARRRHAEMGAGLAEAGLLPTTFTTLKLGEAHIYFHTNPGALTFLNGSWYTSRAFNPPDKGGQPADFPLGIMQFPAVPGAACNECRSIAIGGSYVVNARDQACQGSGGVPQLVRDAGDGQPLARRASRCRPASRATPRR